MATHGTPRNEHVTHHDAVPEKHPSTAIPSPCSQPENPENTAPPAEQRSPACEGRPREDIPEDIPATHARPAPGDRPEAREHSAPHDRPTPGEHSASHDRPAAREHPAHHNAPTAPERPVPGPSPAGRRPRRALLALGGVIVLLAAGSLTCVCLAVHQLAHHSPLADSYLGLAGVAMTGVAACVPLFVHLRRS